MAVLKKIKQNSSFYWGSPTHTDPTHRETPTFLPKALDVRGKMQVANGFIEYTYKLKTITLSLLGHWL